MDVGLIVSITTLAALAIVVYRMGEQRWFLPWTESLWGASIALFFLFFPWYLLTIGLDAPAAMIPLGMAVIIGGFCVGLYRRQLRARAQRAAHKSVSYQSGAE